MTAFVPSSPWIIESRFARRIPLESALRFIDALAALPISSWMDIGRSLVADDEGLANRVAAWVALDAIIADRGLRVGAWYVRDALETAVFLARRGDPLRSAADRQAFDAARNAAEDVALAWLAFPRLAVPDFETLCRPFAQHVRIGPLGGKPPAGQYERLRRASSRRTG